MGLKVQAKEPELPYYKGGRGLNVAEQRNYNTWNNNHDSS